MHLAQQNYGDDKDEDDHRRMDHGIGPGDV
jgi:hypothetical protein